MDADDGSLSRLLAKYDTGVSWERHSRRRRTMAAATPYTGNSPRALLEKVDPDVYWDKAARLWQFPSQATTHQVTRLARTLLDFFARPLIIIRKSLEWEKCDLRCQAAVGPEEDCVCACDGCYHGSSHDTPTTYRWTFVRGTTVIRNVGLGEFYIPVHRPSDLDRMLPAKARHQRY